MSALTFPPNLFASPTTAPYRAPSSPPAARGDARAPGRTATFAVVKDGAPPAALAAALCARGVYCTAGNHYSTMWSAGHVGPGFDDAEGVARLGLLHYNTHADVERILEALEAAR